MQTAVTKRGQTVIPAAIRKRHRIGGGARLVSGFPETMGLKGLAIFP
jgi:hypothetical protein